MTINEKIREISAKWINPTYAKHVHVSTQIKDLAAYAFENMLMEGEDTRAVRFAMKKLERQELDHDWEPLA